MRLLRWAGPCLAALVAGETAPSEDAAALIQSAVRTHIEAGRSGASTLFGGALEAALGMLSRHAQKASQAEPTAPTASQRIVGALFTEKSASGASATFQVSKEGCDGCEFTWGDRVHLRMPVHSPEGFELGDTVSLTLDLSFDIANTKNFLSTVLMGQTHTLQSSCQLCDGVCRASDGGKAEPAEPHGFGFEVTYPTTLRGRHYCREGLTDIVMFEEGLKLPMLDAAGLQLSGQINVTSRLIRGGEEKASSVYSLDFQPVGGGAPAVGRVARDRDDFPGYLQLTLGSVLEGAAAAIAEDEVEDLNKEGMPESVNAIVSEVFVYELENSDGENVSVSADGCRKRGVDGSTQCLLRFGHPDSFSSSLHLASMLDQGSYMLFSMTPRVHGLAGHFLKKQMESHTVTELEIPLCDEHGDSFGIQLFGKWKELKLPPCGYYALNMDVAPMEISLPRKMPLPFSLPGPLASLSGSADLNHLPPMSLDFRIQLFHQGAVPILDMRFKLGLEKATY